MFNIWFQEASKDANLSAFLSKNKYVSNVYSR